MLSAILGLLPTAIQPSGLEPGLGGEADRGVGGSIGLVPAALYPPTVTSDLPSYLDATSRVLRSCNARGVITSAALLPHIELLKAACPDLSAIVRFDALQGPSATMAGAPQPAEIAFVQFTSGSTATPKGVIVTQRNLAANV